jgi:hypothetical protein
MSIVVAKSRHMGSRAQDYSFLRSLVSIKYRGMGTSSSRGFSRRFACSVSRMSGHPLIRGMSQSSSLGCGALCGSEFARLCHWNNPFTIEMTTTEVIAASNTTLSRHYQLARWIDGPTWAWMALRKTVGRGEGSSGLRFDSVNARD